MKLPLPAYALVFLASVTLLYGVPGSLQASEIHSAGCYTLHTDVGYGEQDSVSSTTVDTLQRFLAEQGLFEEARLGTGHFGPLTRAAVQRFQAAHGVPPTGFVGPLTRAALMKVQPECGTPSLYSVSPTSGSVGTTVSLRGTGFSSANTILIDGMIAQRNVPIASSVAISCTNDPECHGGINQTLTFQLPSSLSPDCPAGYACALYVRLLTPADVRITVKNDSGVSNALPFRVEK